MKTIEMDEDLLQVNLDKTGDYFILLFRDKFGVVHITGPNTYHSGDILLLNTPAVKLIAEQASEKRGK